MNPKASNEGFAPCQLTPNVPISGHVGDAAGAVLSPCLESGSAELVPARKDTARRSDVGDNAI